MYDVKRERGPGNVRLQPRLVLEEIMSLRKCPICIGTKGKVPSGQDPTYLLPICSSKPKDSYCYKVRTNKS